LVPRQMLLTLVHDPLRRSVGRTHTDSSKTSSELSFRASTPSDVLPLGIGQHVFGWYRQNVRNRALTRTAALGNWPNQVHADRVHLEMARDANGPGQTARREPLPEWRAQSVPGISERTAKMDTGCNHTVDLSERNLRLRSRSLMFGRNPSPLQTCPLARPAFGKAEAQSHRHGHPAARQRQRHQRLAIGGLAQCRSILRTDADRVLAFLRHCSVVDHQHRIAAADELVSLDEKFCFQRGHIPDASSNKMMQLIRSCDHPGRSTPLRKADTSAAAPCDPNAPGMA